MAYVNIVEWKPEHVSDWLKGLGDGFELYGNVFQKRNVDGKKLLMLCASDLPDYSVYKVGHQEIILEGIELLRSFHYDLENENLQQLALRLSCKSRSLNRELSDSNYELKPNKGDKVATITIAAVADILVSVKAMLSWLDRYPFYGQDQYSPIKARVLQLGMELATNAQRDSFAENPVDVIRDRCHELSCLCDAIIQDFCDPLIIQPASLDVITIKQNPDCQLDIIRQSAYSGIHIIGEIKYHNLSYIGGKIEEGDEIVQVNYQTVIGWQHKNLQQLMQKASSDIILTLKKRPRHSSRSCQVYMKPLRLPSRKLTLFTSPVGPTSWMSSSIPLSYSTRHYVSKIPSPLPLKNICITAKNGSSNKLTSKASLSSSSESENEANESISCVIDTLSSENFDDVTVEEVDDDDAFLPAGENMSPVSLRLDFARKTNIRRRATVTGVSPTTKRPHVDIDQLWHNLKQDQGSKTSLSDNLNSIESANSSGIEAVVSEAGSPKPVLKPRLNKAVSLPVESCALQDYPPAIPLKTVVEDAAPVQKQPIPETTNTQLEAEDNTDVNGVETKEEERKSNASDSSPTQHPMRPLSGHCEAPSPPTRYSGGTSVRAMEPCDHQGWLFRRHDGKGLLANKWAKKWFVLKNHTLFGYRDYESSRPESFMGLPGFKVSIAPEVKAKKFTFKVYSCGKTVFFACDSQIDMGQWMNKISSAANLSPSNMTSPSPSQQDTKVCRTRETDSLKRKGSFLSRRKMSTPFANSDSVLASKVDKVKTNQGVIIPTNKYKSYRRVPSDSPPNLAKTDDQTDVTDSSKEDRNEVNCGRVNPLARKVPSRESVDSSQVKRRTYSGASRRGSVDSTSSDKQSLRRRYSSAFIESAHKKNKENYDRYHTTSRLCRLHSCETVKSNFSEFKEKMPIKSYSSSKLLDKTACSRRSCFTSSSTNVSYPRRISDARRESVSGIAQSVEKLSDVTRKSGTLSRKKSSLNSVCSSSNSIGSYSRPSHDSLNSIPTDPLNNNQVFWDGHGTSVSTHDLRPTSDHRHSGSVIQPSASEMSVLDKSDSPRGHSCPYRACCDGHRSPSVSSINSGSRRSLAPSRSPDPCFDGSPEKLWLNSLRNDSKPKSANDSRSKCCNEKRVFQFGRRQSDVSLKKSSTYQPPQPIKSVGGSSRMKLAFEMNLDTQTPSNSQPSPTTKGTLKPFKFFGSPGTSRKFNGSIMRKDKKIDSPGDLSPKTLLGSPRLHKAIFGNQPKRKAEVKPTSNQEDGAVVRKSSDSLCSRSSEAIYWSNVRSQLDDSSSDTVTKSQSDLPSLPSLSGSLTELARTSLKPTMGVSMIGKPRRHDVVSPPSSPVKKCSSYSSHPNSPAYYYSELTAHQFTYNFPQSPVDSPKQYSEAQVSHETKLIDGLEYPPVFVPETYSLPAAAKLAASLQLARLNNPQLKTFDNRANFPWMKSVSCVGTQTEGTHPDGHNFLPTRGERKLDSAENGPNRRVFDLQAFSPPNDKPAESAV